MIYTDLLLKNFRSYESLSSELSPGVNIVVGPNASGKTNLLEAVLVVSQGATYKGADQDLIKFGEDWVRIEARSKDHHRAVKISGAQKEIELDEVKLKRMPLEKTVPITLFEPDHLRMVYGPPETRRNYLDDILKQTTPGIKSVMAKYKRALSQRNRLLKSLKKPSDDHFFVWDVKLSEYGAKLSSERAALIDKINSRSSEIYSELSGSKTKLAVKYDRTVVGSDYASTMLKGLQGNLIKDFERGFTTIGPHREDFSFALGGHEASTSASRGETRTMVLMCKLVEMLIIEDMRDERPILLLDDVFSELDSSRRMALTEYLKDYQTIITTTDADSIVQHFLGDYNVIPTKTRS